ncbi:BCCT family transporter [Tautonia sp. JC769]|uniref:BCCT family transporter n=1 Tax=Tautonia sp. JC769 TaxID=3232135 RepID=UPI003458F84C
MSEPMRTNRGRLGLFHVALPLCIAVSLIGIVWPATFAGTVSDVTQAFFDSVDWFFMGSVTGFLVLAAWLALGRYGSIKLGAPGDEPEFSTGSWLAMLFAAGMGVGLLFWGVAEPMTHFASPPIGEAYSAESARQAMILTMLHWGFHAWAVYSVGALVLAYFHYRVGTNFLAGAPIRAAFRGRWVEPVATLADLFAVLAVALGVAGSLAMGVFQLQTGLNIVLGTPPKALWFALLLLGLLFAAFMTSAATSLDKGIKILSNTNMVLAILLMLFVLLAGPTPFLLRIMFTGLGDYLSALPALSFRLYPHQDLSAWVGSWTLTYFIWWIAWAPFVGIFIARISKGRTIQEFVAGVLLAPTAFSLIWFSVFGGMGMFEELQGAGGIGSIVKEDVTTALFALLDRLPGSVLLTAVALLLLFVFIVTSVDSATYVLGMLSSQGAMDPPRFRKFAWGITLATLGAALVMTRNIEVVRAGAISFALPLTLILLLQAAALIRMIRSNPPAAAIPAPAALTSTKEANG